MALGSVLQWMLEGSLGAGRLQGKECMCQGCQHLRLRDSESMLLSRRPAHCLGLCLSIDP